MKNLLFLWCILPLYLQCSTQSGCPDWAIGPFTRYEGNPIMGPQGEYGTWESQNVYNPAVIWRNDKFHMLYRGENSDTALFDKYRSQIGYAYSLDGIIWVRHKNNPVLKAEFDYELPGGLEDPRLIEKDGVYYCYYTAFSPKNKGIRLCVASSTDLINWTKYGPVFDGPLKNGAILMNPENEPVHVNGKYIMYSSVQDMYIGESEDLIHWNFELMKVHFPKTFYPMEFCIAVTDYEETGENIILFLGGRLNGDQGYNGQTWHYALSQSLLKKSNPRRIVEVLDTPFMIPSEPYEQKGFINHTLFFESLTRHSGKWYLYYGAADHMVALATADAE